MILRAAILIQYRHVTDRQTDGHRAIAYTALAERCVVKTKLFLKNGNLRKVGFFGSRVVSVLDSGAEGPVFKSQSRRCRVTVLGKLLTPIVPLFTK